VKVNGILQLSGGAEKPTREFYISVGPSNTEKICLSLFAKVGVRNEALPCFLGCLQSVNRTAPPSESFMPTIKFRVLDTEVGI
jgi:hypothetical protein